MAKKIIDELVTVFSFKSDSNSKKEINQMQQSMHLLRSKTLAITAALAGAAIVIGLVAKKSDSLIKFSNTIGISSDKVQSFGFAMEQSGGSAQDLNSLLLTVQKTMSSPIPGQYNKGFLLLGVRVRDASGNLKSATQFTLDLADALKKVKKESPTEALQLAQMSGLNTNQARFLEQGSAQIKKNLQEGISAGSIIPKEDLNNAQLFENSLNRMKTTLNAIKNIVILSSLPVITAGVNLLESGLKKVLQTVRMMEMIFKARMSLDKQFSRLLVNKVKSEFAPITKLFIHPKNQIKTNAKTNILKPIQNANPLLAKSQNTNPLLSKSQNTNPLLSKTQNANPLLSKTQNTNPLLAKTQNTNPLLAKTQNNIILPKVKSPSVLSSSTNNTNNNKSVNINNNITIHGAESNKIINQLKSSMQDISVNMAQKINSPGFNSSSIG